MTRLHFGKYSGQRLCDIPGSYLAWCLRECRDLSPWLRREIEAELDARAQQQDRERPPDVYPPADWSDVLRQVKREMCLRFHPDRGGSTEAMQAVNVVFDRLEELAKAG